MQGGNDWNVPLLELEEGGRGEVFGEVVHMRYVRTLPVQQPRHSPPYRRAVKDPRRFTHLLEQREGPSTTGEFRVSGPRPGVRVGQVLRMSGRERAHLQAP